MRRTVVAHVVQLGRRDEAGLLEIRQQRLAVERVAAGQAHQGRVPRHPLIRCAARAGGTV